MVNDEIKQILSLEDKLSERVMGARLCFGQLVQGIKTSKAKLGAQINHKVCSC